MAFCRDIPSHVKIPIPGIKNPRDIPKVKNPESLGFRINPGNENPETQNKSRIPGLTKNPGDFKKKSRWSEDRKNFGDFEIFEIFRSSPK